MLKPYCFTGMLAAATLSFGMMCVAQAPGPQTQTSPQSQTGPQNTNPSSPSTAAPQSPSGMPQGAGSSTSSTTMSQPQSSSPASTPAQAGANAPQGHPGSVEEALQLTPEQKTKLQPIIQDEVNQINAVRNDTSMSIDQKRAKVEEIKKTSFPKILAVLTPEQQKKLSDLQQQARQQAQQQQRTAPPPSTGPSTPDASQPNGAAGPGMGQSGTGRPGTSPGMGGQSTSTPGSTPQGSQPPQ